MRFLNTFDDLIVRIGCQIVLFGFKKKCENAFSISKPMPLLNILKSNLQGFIEALDAPLNKKLQFVPQMFRVR
jgi:hypothetical protein